MLWKLGAVPGSVINKLKSHLHLVIPFENHLTTSWQLVSVPGLSDITNSAANKCA
jgi:hypothetical protein